MATTADYLNKLIAQKNTLADNLVTKGVTATHDETLETLVPKVLNISGGDNVKGTNFSTLVNGAVWQDIYAILYSYLPQNMNMSANGDIIVSENTTEIVEGLNESYVGFFYKDESGSGVVNLSTSSDIVLLQYKLVDSLFFQYNFVTSQAGEVLFVYDGRQVIKMTDDKAYCAYCHGGVDGYFTPLIIGLSDDSTKINVAGTISSALSPQWGQGGTLEKYGKLWYYNFSNPNSISGRPTDTSGANRYYIGDQPTRIYMINKLIDICKPDFFGT